MIYVILLLISSCVDKEAALVGNRKFPGYPEDDYDENYEEEEDDSKNFAFRLDWYKCVKDGSMEGLYRLLQKDIFEKRVSSKYLRDLLKEYDENFLEKIFNYRDFETQKTLLENCIYALVYKYRVAELEQKIGIQPDENSRSTFKDIEMKARLFIRYTTTFFDEDKKSSIFDMVFDKNESNEYLIDKKICSLLIERMTTLQKDMRNVDIYGNTELMLILSKIPEEFLKYRMAVSGTIQRNEPEKTKKYLEGLVALKKERTDILNRNYLDDKVFRSLSQQMPEEVEKVRKLPDFIGKDNINENPKYRETLGNVFKEREEDRIASEILEYKIRAAKKEVEIEFHYKKRSILYMIIQNLVIRKREDKTSTSEEISCFGIKNESNKTVYDIVIDREFGEDIADLFRDDKTGNEKRKQFLNNKY